MNDIRNDPLPLGLALLGAGLGTALVTFGSLGADDVSYARTEWFALMSMILASPAILLYPSSAHSTGLWWRCFWTAALYAYLLHFWWSTFRTYDGKFDAILARQGWVAYSNFLVTIIWTIDVAAAWTIQDRHRVISLLHFVAWLSVTASFVVAAAFFRRGPVSWLGEALLAGVLVTLVTRAKRWIDAASSA